MFKKSLQYRIGQLYSTREKHSQIYITYMSTKKVHERIFIKYIFIKYLCIVHSDQHLHNNNRQSNMCIAKTEKGTQCSRRCIQDSDMCKIHTEMYAKFDIFLYEWFTTASYARPLRWRPVEFKRAAKFIGDVDNARNAAEVRRHVEARLLELGKDFAARRIANTWRWVNANPNYKVCRDRLMREFAEMAGTT